MMTDVCYQGGFIIYPSFSLPAVLNATMEFYRTSTDPRTQVLTTTASSPIGGSTSIVLFFHDGPERPEVFDLFIDIPHVVNTMRAQRFYEFVESIPSEIVALVNFRGAFATMSTSALTQAFLEAVKNETDVSFDLALKATPLILTPPTEVRPSHGQPSRRPDQL
jgi:hypothetical protein